MKVSLRFIIVNQDPKLEFKIGIPHAKIGILDIENELAKFKILLSPLKFWYLRDIGILHVLGPELSATSPMRCMDPID